MQDAGVAMIVDDMSEGNIDADLVGGGVMTALPRGSVIRSDDPAHLRAVLSPDCALAIWDRHLPANLAEHVTQLDLEGVDDVDAVIGADAATLEAAVLLGAAGYEGRAAAALASEIGAMANHLGLMTLAERFRIRLEIVETDACRRFHADMVTMRLLVTLLGPGTQWIETNAPDTIQEVPAGAVAIFKGRLLAPDPAVLHRSPPIAGTGIRRILLAIDPA